LIPHPIRAREASDPELAVVLTGGGARAAYQVGFLRHLAREYPDLAPGILAGVSAGGMIAMHLASRSGRFADSVARLVDIWQNLRIDDVCRVDAVDFSSITRWAFTRLCGRACKRARRASVAGTEPLRRLLTQTLNAAPDGTFSRIADNLQAGVVRSVALTASSYGTGHSVTWVQRHGHFSALTGDGGHSQPIDGSLRVDHVMASGALPFVFPAVEIDGGWYGDGGMRLTAPLSPAIHLGARRIIAVSTRYSGADAEIRHTAVNAHPAPTQVAGTLLNAVFLDMLDADASRIQQVNALIERLPAARGAGLHHVETLVLRPSQDLGRLANEFEADLPRGLRFFVHGLRGREARSNDLLSLLMFQRDYMTRLIELGEADARARALEIAAFLTHPPASSFHLPTLATA
jgi:NTE family protein